MTRESIKTLFFSILVLGIAFLSYSIGAMSAEKGSVVKLWFGSKDLRLIEDTLRLIRDNYVKPIEDEKEFIYSALQGLVGRLREKPYNDKYSTFLEPIAWRTLSATAEGGYSGIGVVLGLDPARNLPVIASVFENTPAFSAGLKERDFILEVDGKTTENSVLDQIARQIMGEPGTEVTLSILREGWTEPKKVTLKRAKVELPSVSEKRMLDKNVGYFRVSFFGVKTAEEVKSAVGTLLKKGAKSLVIDLRYNPGGLLESAVEVADLFLTEGAIVSVKQKGRKDTTIFAEVDEDDLDIPLAILTNEYSASASEVFAGALQDNGRAKIVGTHTFGKGSVQEVYELENGQSALSLTVGSYLTPKGKNLNEEPLSPDIIADMDTLAKSFPEIRIKQEELKKETERQSELIMELSEQYSNAQVEKAKIVAQDMLVISER